MLAATQALTLTPNPIPAVSATTTDLYLDTLGSGRGKASRAAARSREVPEPGVSLTSMPPSGDAASAPASAGGRVGPPRALVAASWLRPASAATGSPQPAALPPPARPLSGSVDHPAASLAELDPPAPAPLPRPGPAPVTLSLDDEAFRMRK